MSSNKDNEEAGGGFAGLSALVSDVTETVEQSKKETSPSQKQPESLAEPVPAVPKRAAPAQEPVPEPSVVPAIPQDKTNEGQIWAIGLLVVGAFAFAIFSSGENKQAQERQQATYTQPAAQEVPTAPPSPTPTLPARQKKQKIPAETTSMEIPPVGVNLLLTTNQLRYCRTEHVRLGFIQKVVSRTSNTEIESFNARVADFNSRCSKFQYRQGELQQIDAEVAARRNKIGTAAQRLWVREAPGIQSSNTKEKKAKHPTDRAKQEAQEHPENNPFLVPKPANNPFIAPTPATPPTNYGVPSPRNQSSMPENAELDYTGRAWTCKRGYRRQGSSCEFVQLPSNAELDYTGHAWTCMRGFRTAGNACDRVGLPANAELDYTGHAWTCIRGYKQSGNSCEQVGMPNNAEVDYTGHGWVCMRGYRRNGNSCDFIALPANAEIDYTGHAWVCSRGFQNVGNRCQGLDMPSNAEIDYTGHNWTCSRGYRRNGNSCDSIVVPYNGEIDYTGHNWTCSRGYVRAGNECRPI